MPLPGVEFLGPLPQAHVHQEVRSALCTFFPNFVIPETFGLVFAESHALGTPVLTVDCGAAREVLGDPAEVLPLKNSYRLYEAAVRPAAGGAARRPGASGRTGGPVRCVHARACARGARVHGRRPQPDARFQLANVVPRWRALFAR